MKKNIVTASILSFWLTGCSLFFGNVKPIDERSSTYHILDLSKEIPEWKKIDSDNKHQPPDPQEIPESGLSDVAFQSEDTASVISINSACKSYQNPGNEKNLKELTRELLLGFSEISLENETPLIVDNTPSLQTTLKGRLSQENVMIRTVVLQKGNCVYDLMYLSRPENFKTHENDFNHFVNSFSSK